MWVDLIKFFGPIFAVCGTALGVCKLLVNARGKEALPLCLKRFGDMENDIKTLQKSDTDRSNLLSAISAGMKLIEEQSKEIKAENKERNKAIADLTTSVEKMNQGLEFLERKVDEKVGEQTQSLQEIIKAIRSIRPNTKNSIP